MRLAGNVTCSTDIVIFYVRSPNFDTMNVIITLLLKTKCHENVKGAIHDNFTRAGEVLYILWSSHILHASS